jgi:hypothetical protein
LQFASTSFAPPPVIVVPHTTVELSDTEANDPLVVLLHVLKEANV